MTKKHYVKIAAAFEQACGLLHGEDRDLVQGIAETLCDVFKTDNSSFDRSRFLSACGF